MTDDLMKREALRELLSAISWLTDCQMEDLTDILRFFHTQQACYLEVMTGQMPDESKDAAFAYQVLSNTLTGLIRFRCRFPDASLFTMLSEEELDSGMEL